MTADSDSTKPAERRRRPPRKKGASPPPAAAPPSGSTPARQGAPSLQARAARVHRDLQALARELADRLDVPLGGSDPVREIDLHLRLSLDGAPARDGVAAAHILDAVADRLRDLQDTGDTVVTGRVHCFQCRRDDCVHASPPDPRSVFLAYTATGKPAWCEFTEACLAWGEPRVDLLYEEPPTVIAVQRSGHDLSGELIAGFGRDERSYRLLGQVACGYLPFTGPQGRDRGALTLQVVGARRGRGPVRLHLNAVGLHAGLEAGRGRPAWWDQRALTDCIRDAREQLQALSLRLRGLDGGVRREIEGGVDAALGRLRGALERRYRPQQHRTLHARERRSEGDRPTHAAVADAERAADERLLYEPDRDTVIVLGPKGRVHVFAGDGRHVTSLHHQRDAIERRLDRKQWVPCEAARMARFRASIAKLAGRPAGEP